MPKCQSKSYIKNHVVVYKLVFNASAIRFIQFSSHFSEANGKMYG